MTAMIMVKEHGREPQYIRFINGDAANNAIGLLTKQPNVKWAIRMSDYPDGVNEALYEIELQRRSLPSIDDCLLSLLRA